MKAPTDGWCRHVGLKYPDVNVRVHSCFPLESGEFLEDVSFEGAGWQGAMRDALRTTNVADATMLRDEPNRGWVRFLVKACPLVAALRGAGTLPRLPFRVVNGDDYWVFVTRSQNARHVLTSLQRSNLNADVVYSGTYEVPDALTPRQTEILEAAVREGYYDYPRRINLSGLAARLAISKSTLSEALVMLEKEVVHRYVDGALDRLPGPEIPPNPPLPHVV